MPTKHSYLSFVPCFSWHSTALRMLLRKGVAFKWTDAQERAFNTLKKKLSSPPTLAYPDLALPFTVTTDASATALGAVLSQFVTQEDGKERERVVAYASRSLNSAEINYDTRE